MWPSSQVRAAESNNVALSKVRLDGSHWRWITIRRRFCSWKRCWFKFRLVFRGVGVWIMEAWGWETFSGWLSSEKAPGKNSVIGLYFSTSTFMFFRTAEAQTYLDSLESNLCLAGEEVRWSLQSVSSRANGDELRIWGGIMHCSCRWNVFMACRSLGPSIFRSRQTWCLSREVGTLGTRTRVFWILTSFYSGNPTRIQGQMFRH